MGGTLDNTRCKVIYLIKIMKSYSYGMKLSLLFFVSVSILTVPATSSFAAKNDPKRALNVDLRDLEAPPMRWDIPALEEEGRWKLDFDASGNYDSNIFLTDTDRKGDFITVLSPSMMAQAGNSDHMYFLTYNADVLLYALYPHQSRVNQNLEGRAEVFRNGRVKITLLDRLQPTSYAASSETNDFVKRLQNDLEVTADWRISEKTSLTLGYKQTLQNYISSSYENFSYLNDGAFAKVSWHATPKISLFSRFDIDNFFYYNDMKQLVSGIHYTSSYDSVNYKGVFGVEGYMTEKSSIYFEAGADYKDYHAESRKSPLTSVFKGIYRQKLSPKTDLELIVSRSFVESTYYDQGYYTSMNYYASMNFRPVKNLDLGVQAFYLNSEYPGDVNFVGAASLNPPLKRRVDNEYGFGVSAAYHVGKWITPRLMYQYKNRSSNIDTLRFFDNQLTLGADIGF